MPNIKSQKDRVVQAASEQAHNKAIKTNLKTVVKKANAAIDAKAADKDATVLAAVSAIDKARSGRDFAGSRIEAPVTASFTAQADGDEVR